MRRSGLVRRLFEGLGLFLLPAPVFLLAGAGAGVGAWLLAPLLLALLLSMGIRRLPARVRLPGIGLSMVLCGLLALWLGRGAAEQAWRWLGGVLAGLAAALYPRWLSRMRRTAAHTSAWYAGLALAGAAWLLSALIPLPEAGETLRVYTWVYSVYIIFALNGESLEEGVGSGRAPSRAMTVRNTIAALLWTGLFLLFTHLPQVAQALKACLNAIARAVAWLAGLFSREEPRGGEMGGGRMDFSELAGETAEPSWLMALLEKALYILGIALAAVALFFLLRLAIRALIRLAKALTARLRAYMDAVNENYEDQVESLLDWGEVRRGLEERRERRREAKERRVPWDRLSPREQVRRSYQQFLSRHPDIPPQRTARQALSDPRQAGIYEAACYSSRDITPEEAMEARTGMRAKR